MYVDKTCLLAVSPSRLHAVSTPSHSWTLLQDTHCKHQGRCQAPTILILSQKVSKNTKDYFYFPVLLLNTIKYLISISYVLKSFSKFLQDMFQFATSVNSCFFCLKIRQVKTISNTALMFKKYLPNNKNP